MGAAGHPDPHPSLEAAGITAVNLHLARDAGMAACKCLMRFGPAVPYLTGMFLFSVMNAMMKHAVLFYPVVAANAWRYLFAAITAFLFWWLAGAPRVFRAAVPLHVLRGTLIAISAVAFFWSLTRLTLVETITLTFVAPLLVPPLAALFLREPLDPRAVGNGVLGFVRVVVASGVGTEHLNSARVAGILSALAGALSYALSTILMRARAPQDGAAVTGLLGAVVPALVLVAAALITLPGGPLVPRASDLPLFAAAGVCGALAIWLFAAALATSDVQSIAPFEFTSIAWLALFGWLIYGESISLRTLIGAGIVVAASIRQARRGDPRLPPVP